MGAKKGHKCLKKIKNLEKLLLSYNSEIKDEMINKKNELLNYVKTKCASASNYFIFYYEDYLEKELNKYLPIKKGKVHYNGDKYIIKRRREHI